MSVFKGIRTKNGAFVTYDGFPLDLRLDIKEHSPMGFEWGYNGSGAKQLALSMLTKLTSDELTIKYYDEFCKIFIETIYKDEWEIKSRIIQEWLIDKNIAIIKPMLTPRFNLLSSDNKNFNMFLDNTKLGENQDYNVPRKTNHLIQHSYFIPYATLGNSEFSDTKQLMNLS